MTGPLPLRYKVASEPEELSQIHRLNYRTFVSEIPQHEPNEREELVDRFHRENTYVVALRGKSLVGMIAVRGERPFSLDAKVENLDLHLPPGRATCEIRLLSVEPRHRTGRVFRGLVECLSRHCLERGHDLAVISGTERQLKLYRNIGFVPFGPPVGTPEARYQPMYLTLEDFRRRGRAFRARAPCATSFLPGPVEVAPEVAAALAEPPISHRSDEFDAVIASVRRRLLALTGASRVQLLLGSGTLGNEAVAAQLSRGGEHGLVLSNGEFGERLADHAARWNLPHTLLRSAWGSAFEASELATALEQHPRPRWVWAVHCETSTGMLNDLPLLREHCGSRGIRLCLDCISSVGAIPVDLREVHLASAVSGKGIGALAGIAMVFHDHPISPDPRLPRYLDLGLYSGGDGIPFTQSAPLVRALAAALHANPDPAERAGTTAGAARSLREKLRAMSLPPLVRDGAASPAVTTIALPAGIRSSEIGERMEAAGYLLSHRSAYLRERNWIQVCLMGAYRADRIDGLTRSLQRVIREEAMAAAAETRV